MQQNCDKDNTSDAMVEGARLVHAIFLLKSLINCEVSLVSGFNFVIRFIASF